MLEKNAYLKSCCKAHRFVTLLFKSEINYLCLFFFFFFLIECVNFDVFVLYFSNITFCSC